MVNQLDPVRQAFVDVAQWSATCNNETETRRNEQPRPQLARDVAQTVLDTLRHFRDHEPKEYDALLATDSGVLIMDLWDALKALAKPDTMQAMEGEEGYTLVDIPHER